MAERECEREPRPGLTKNSRRNQYVRTGFEEFPAELACGVHHPLPGGVWAARSAGRARETISLPEHAILFLGRFGWSPGQGLVGLKLLQSNIVTTQVLGALMEP